MKKRKSDKKLLHEAIRLMMEEEWREANEEIREHPPAFSPEFHEKMKRLIPLKPSVDTFAVQNEADIGGQTWQDIHSLTQEDSSDPHHIPFRLRGRYIAVAALLMVGMSAVALANDDIREGLYRLRFQFSSDNVTIEATPESTTEQGDDNAASEGFHAYKWKEVPEGYEVVYEEEDATLQFYMVNFENKNGNYIDYSQANIENSQHYISYDSQEGYKRIIELTDEIEAYSISDGRNNTIFYEKNGYLFDFMSDQPEETILEYIEMSGILEYEN